LEKIDVEEIRELLDEDEGTKNNTNVTNTKMIIPKTMADRFATFLPRTK